jgi:hypothetical protein
VGKAGYSQTYLSAWKTTMARPLAEAIVNLSDKKLRFPKKICDLLEKISTDLQIAQAEGKGT